LRESARLQGNESIPSLEEANIETLCANTNSTVPISFNGLTAATAPLTNLGYNRIDLSWLPASGSFDRYIALMSTNPIYLATGFSIQGGDLALYKVAEIILNDSNPNPTSLNLVGLNPTTSYYVAIGACLNAACTAFSDSAFKNVKEVFTIPAVAQFRSGFVPILTVPDGPEAVNTLTIDYELPSKLEGYYDDSNGIRIYKTDLAGTIVSSNWLEEYDDAFPTIPGWVTDPSTTTQTQIKGLTDGQTYYFIVKAVLTDPREADGLVYSSNTGVASQKVGRVVPDFSGVVSCYSETPTTMKINWSSPTKGTFNYYEVYLRDSGTSPTTGESFFKTAYDVFDIGGTPSDYSISQALKTASSTVVSGLVPSTNYKIGLKTTFYNSTSGKYERDSNTIIISCTTKTPSITFNGWFDLYSIGPKIDGTVQTERTVLREKIAPDGYDTYGHVVTDPTAPEMPIDGTYYNRYAKECVFDTDDCQSTNSSENGIIRLDWEDMTISDTGGKTLYDYKDLVDSDGNNTVGYRVYRMDYNEGLHAVIPPGVNDSWTLISGAKLIIPKLKNVYATSPTGSNVLTKQKRLGEWIDYTVSRSALATNQTKLYWYKIEAVMKGNRMPYHFEADSSLKVGDEFIRVVLPPDNQAFAHRWIMNRQMCELILKDYNRAKNYRCLYNGLGSTKDTSDNLYYYDIKKHLIADRFEGSCNFTRGACSGAGSHSGKPDCVGQGYPTNLAVDAPTGSVYANINNDEGNGMCWFKKSTGWVSTSSGFSCDTQSGINCSLPPLSASYPNGLDYGKLFRSNAARLRPLNLSQYSSYHLCRAFSINHRSASVVGRLGRRKELIPLGSYSPYMTLQNAEKLTTAALYSAASGKNRSCNYNRYVTLFPFTYPNYLNYNNWPAYNGGGSWGGGRIGITGSRNDINNTTSSEACESRFGLNDFYGNVNEMSSDQMSFNAINPSAYGMSFFKALHLTTDWNLAVDFTPLDPDSRLDWKNGNEEYFKVGPSTDSFSNLDYTPLTGYSGNTVTGITVSNFMGTPTYFNPIMGIGLDCANSTCMNNATDDTRISSKTTVGTAAISGFAFTKGLNLVWNGGKNLLNWHLGGTYGSGGFLYQTNMMGDPTGVSMPVGGNPRCIFPIDEGVNQ